MIEISREVAEKFPKLSIILRIVEQVRVEAENPELEKLRKEIEEEARSKFKIEELKQVEIFRAYRDFLWRLGVDPTKVRPAGEALVRRVLSGKSIPKINTVVDSYNLASLKTGVSLAALDQAKIKGTLNLRFAKFGEEFIDISMEQPMKLKGVELVLSDKEKLLAIYPYRDSEASKVTLNTSNVALLVCGVPKISLEVLEQAERLAVVFLEKFCRGRAGSRYVDST